MVTLKPGVDMVKHMHLVSQLHESSLNLGNATFRGISHTYSIAGFQGYAGHFHRSVIDQLGQHADIAAIEADQDWHPSAWSQQRGATRALELISHRDRNNPTRTYIYDSTAGRGTFVYILDGGIQFDHVDFGGRVVLGYNALSKFPFRDVTGHGTITAGLVGSNTYGVAKKCTMVAIKVSQLSALSTVIVDGIEWAINDIRSHRREAKAVLLLSMNGPRSLVLDTVVEEAYRHGITLVVSAGNQGMNARDFSPGRPQGAIMVGSTDNRRRRAHFSNYGPNVDIFAPGLDIQSTYIGPSRQETKVESGTSSSAAIVAGLLAYFKGKVDLPNAAVARRYLYSQALENEVHDSRATRSLFAYNGSGS